MSDKKKAIVAMSGGVDSSVTAQLMLDAGYECAGITMNLFRKDDPNRPKDVEDAQSVADRINIPFHVADFTERFNKEVISRFIETYKRGETPNPCVYCNRHLKFGELLAEARRLGYDYIATGHYARITYDEASGRYLLRKALNPQKDQSYVLYSLTQDQLAHTIFPLGDYDKSEVRAIAESHDFVNAHKSDSQDICFIPDGKYAEFIEKRTGKKFKPGKFVDTQGNVLGTHKGIIYYTVGQRKGLGLALPQPMYVKEIDVAKNEVVLCTNEELFTTKVIAREINLIDCERITEPRRLKARIRYHHVEQPATVTQIDDDTLEIIFDEPQRAITKGQSVVLYNEDIVVGGGTIS